MEKGDRIFSYTILIISAIVVLVPMVWAISNAFRSSEELASMSGLSIYTFIPKEFTLKNFMTMFTSLNFGRAIINTVIVASTVTFGSLIVNAMGGYAFARLTFPGKNILFLILLSTLMVPIEVLIISLYGTIKNLYMMDRMAALIIPFLANAFGIFFMRQSVKGIPKELDEAAIIDGCNRFGVFFRVILPLLKSSM